MHTFSGGGLASGERSMNWPVLHTVTTYFPTDLTEWEECRSMWSSLCSTSYYSWLWYHYNMGSTLPGMQSTWWKCVKRFRIGRRFPRPSLDRLGSPESGTSILWLGTKTGTGMYCKFYVRCALLLPPRPQNPVEWTQALPPIGLLSRLTLIRANSRCIFMAKLMPLYFGM